MPDTTRFHQVGRGSGELERRGDSRGPIGAVSGLAARDLPTIGITGVWVDPDSADHAHGVSGSVADALRRLGVYAGYREAFPLTGARVIRRWLQVTGRQHDISSVMLSHELRTWSRIWNARQRATTPRSVDAWLLLCGARSVRGRYATLTDQSPHQILRRSTTPAILLYPHASEAQLRSVEKSALLTCKRAYVSCTASHWAASSFVKDVNVDPCSVKVVGFGVGAGHDPDQIRVAERDWTTPRFLFVGHSWKRKNGDGVVRAFRSIRQYSPDATLHVVGEHPRLSEEGVFGYGPVTRREPNGLRTLNELFGRATCFVMPSWVEPFGHVYVEAGTVGVASIGTTEGGAADAIGAGGLLVAPDDHHALLDAMGHFCRPEFAYQLGAKAFQHSKLLSWDLVAQRLLRALDVSVPGLELADFL